MAAKQLIFNQEAQNALVRGVDIVADAVKKTLGPKGRNASEIDDSAKKIEDILRFAVDSIFYTKKTNREEKKY